MPLRLRRLAALAAGLAAACAPVAGCGSSSSSPDAEPGPSAPARDFPSAKGRTLAQVISGLARGPVFAPSVSLLERGVNRIGFALFTTGGKQVQDAGVALYVGRLDGAQARGPYVARSESLKVRPQFESRTTASDPQAARSVYVADVPFARDGRYAVLAVARVDGRTVATSAFGMTVGGRKVLPPGPGDRAPVIHTLTPADVGGDLAKIDTRLPPAPQLLADDFADVVGRKPVVLTFATPQLCQSRVCGPVVDVVAEVQAQTGSKVAFIHQEIYRDNDVAKGLRPQLAPYHLESEPWTFVIDRLGRVSTRIEGAFSAGELERAVQKVL